MLPVSSFLFPKLPMVSSQHGHESRERIFSNSLYDTVCRFQTVGAPINL